MFLKVFFQMVLQEGGQVREVNLCDGRWTQRKSQVFTSKTHQVTVQMRQGGSISRNSIYLLEYEGNSFLCYEISFIRSEGV